MLFLTARADIGDNERARGAGVVGHVTKPFNPSSLGDEVRAALARWTSPEAGLGEVDGLAGLELEALDDEPQELCAREAPQLGSRRARGRAGGAR